MSLPRFCLLLTVTAIGHAAQPVQLTAYLQKFRTFYQLGDSAIPSAHNQPAAPTPMDGLTAIAVASDGAVWYGNVSSLVRFDSKGAPEDRSQYFAG